MSYSRWSFDQDALAVLDENGAAIVEVPNALVGCLVASAPDLLAALKMAKFWLDLEGRYDMQAINMAIAKAEGR